MCVKIRTNYESLINSTSKKERGDIKVYVGMSGGVDSSVTAYLLKKKGFDVKGIYMMCWGSDDPNCRAHQDRADAIKVASFLNIPIEVWDFEKEYKERVIEYFFAEYKNGRTPNPDILCNSEIKFKLFLEKALKSGADYIATGHYSKVINFGNYKSQITNNKQVTNLKLKNQNLVASENSVNYISNNNLAIEQFNNGISRSYSTEREHVGSSSTNMLFITSGFDMWKDQSYFLSRVKSNMLNKIIFPLGSLVKNRRMDGDKNDHTIRKIANSIKLPVAKKEDSTGICFLENIDVQDFLKTEINEKKGNVIKKSGEVIGAHRGVWFYTIGQRHGFDITKYQGKPLYVLEKDVDKNELIVGDKKDLIKKEFEIEGLELRTKDSELSKLVNDRKIYVRIRNLGEFEKVKNLQKISTNHYQLSLINYLEAVAPGQFAVFYWIDSCVHNEKVIVGSGVIA